MIVVLLVRKIQLQIRKITDICRVFFQNWQFLKIIKGKCKLAIKNLKDLFKNME